MADIILRNVLNTNIKIDELFDWLTSENTEDTILPDIVQNGTTRAEFVSFFLNYLREQCKSVLPEVKDVPEKPLKKPTRNEPQLEAAPTIRESLPVEVPNTSRSVDKLESRCRNESPSSSYSDYKSRHGGQPVFRQQPKTSPRPQNASTAATSTGSPSNLRMPPAHFPPLPCQQNVNSTAQNPAFHQTPAVQHPYVQANVLQPISPRHCPDTGPNVKFGNCSPVISQAQIQMRNLSVSSASEICDNSFSNASVDASSPRRFHNSMINGSEVVNSSNVPISPISPLYVNNTSNLCPRRNNKSQNDKSSKSNNSTSGGGNNSTCTSTPKAGSGQKSAKGAKKPEQNQSRCLGDFVTSTEQQGSSKKSAKKLSNRQIKTQLWKERQAAAPPANGKTSRRRIKPTKLVVSDETKNRGKEVFGVISRPTAVNPKFVEAPSTDKSEAEVSFDVERCLLKLERQRQPKNESTTETAIVEQKSSKKTKVESTVVPRLDSVDNVENLNTLARVYSGILDRNLMTNPMTELYFLVTLLTNPYKKTDEKKCPIEKKITSDDEKFSSSVQILETLKDDLGCAELTDEAELDERESSNGDEESNDKSSVEDENDCSVRSNLTDSSETRKIESKNLTDEYLGTAHNCVYFATEVLLHQHYLLSFLDRATLKLLSENQQIAEFRPELKKYINCIYTTKCSQTNRTKQTDSGNSQTNVCFQVDTDNRETFPSLVAFSLFRKQRDSFYDILKTWEEKHLTKDWIFSKALKLKINALLTLHTDPVNYCHFAKLFVSQLLVSSVQSVQAEDPANDESLSFLKSLKHLNPEKLMQLKERLVTPLSSSGPVPQPAFPGVQEFYKEFILVASDWKFYTILEMSLIREILELNEVQFAVSEIEGTGTTVDESTKQNFITCVSSLRLLAKFLSFMVSLPLRSASNSPEWFGLQTQLQSRISPSLDLQGTLVDAVTHGRLSLTVPWIVQYMAMLDTITLRMPYYANIGEILYCIYRISNKSHTRSSSDDSISPQTAVLMMFTIGWLFELPNFPRELHAYWQINCDPRKLRILGRTDIDETKVNDLTTVNVESSKEFQKYNSNLDKLDIIDDRALYECCPFLAEFKVLLISGNSVIGNSNANRHITPVSSQLSQPAFGVKKKNLQMQLEDAFFHGQPSSIRKTVDFVAERVASSCVKYICNTIIPAAKERNMKEFIKSENGKLDFTVKDDEEDEEEPASSPKQSPTKSSRKAQAEVLERQLEALAKTIMNEVKKDGREEISEMCETRTLKSIESLLADETVPCVKETCIAIAKRNATERIDQWIDSHIIESLFLKTMTFELKRLLKEGDVDQAEKENRHNPEVPCPTEVIGMMRGSMWELLERKGRWAQLSLDSVRKILTCLQQTLRQRADLVDHPERNLYKMSVEYCLLLLTHRQDLYSSEIQQQFIKVWKMNNVRGGGSNDLFARIISPRNIRLLDNKSHPSVFRVFGRLLKGLLKEDLLSIEALSEQCVALFRQEWPTSILKQLSQCLNDVVSDYKSSNVHAEGVKQLLGWIASTCDEMEIWDYSMDGSM